MATKKATQEFVINVYDKDKNIIKTSKAVDTQIRFGSVRKIMALLDMDDLNDTASLFKAIYGAWDEVTYVLTECFPDMEEQDWDNVYINELIPVIVGIAKSSFYKLFEIPSDSKN